MNKHALRRARPVAWLALLLVAVGMGGCDERDEAGDRARLEAMEAEIDRMIADRSCTGDGSCRVIAFGAKPCGGPWEYKIYSAEHVDTLALQQSVTEYDEFNRELNERYNWVSDCSVPSPPMVVCNQGECRGALPTGP
jgi:hypothetical protein